MMAVITDDLTGASEIGGIALAKGYRTVIETQTVTKSDADVLVIATNMRALDAESAARKSSLLTRQILALEPDLIFKKVDSVLRGNIGPELEAQMKAEKKSRALLIPANPSRQRTIANGIYYVDSTPVAESGFAQTHDFASTTSQVVDILVNRGASNAMCISPSDDYSAVGVHIGNTQNADDLHAWAGKIDDQLVPAGAADFFSAILDTRPPSVNGKDIGNVERGNGRSLYVCGSNFPSSRIAVADAQNHGIFVVGMPDNIYFAQGPDAALLNGWSRQVSAALLAHTDVAISATQTPNDSSLSGQMITQAMAEVTRQVVGNGSIDFLMIEGGATAQAVVKALNIDSLFPVQTLAQGVTRMRVDRYPGLHVTMKPGSYGWPEVIWKSNN